MSLEEQVNADIKKAMLAKDPKALEALRAVKASLLLVKTGKDSKDGEISKDAEISLLQRLVKQRKESAEIYLNQERQELADVELFQVEVIQKYLPEQISEEEVGRIIEKIIQETGASSMKDMGKVMALASKKLAGKAESKQIASIVKSKLT
ncbi:MAG: GatB/YqeY domain-containing protein [Bacteroidetes bacterium]|nr:GatB/YqeY domain-containing protein [Bacteroidota bacterium]